MSANLTIDDLSDEQVADSQAFIKNFLSDKFPSMDLEPGRVLHDLVLKAGAYVHVLNQEDMDRLRRSSSLYEIEQDPSLADENTVDRVISNYLIARRTGTKAGGQVTIIISDNTTTTVGEGAIFVANNLNFVTTQPFIGTAGSLTTTYSRPIVERTDGSYSFTIDVVAEATGSAYLLKQDTRMVWTRPTANYIDSVVEEDFTGGVNTETNEDLLNRMQDGISTKVMGGRDNIAALIRENFPSVGVISQPGNGDPEMIRDQVFGISAGGKVDIYPRTATTPIMQTLTKACLLIDADEHIFQMTLLRDDYPGFYEVRSIKPVGAGETEGSLEVVQEVRGVDESDLPYNAPKIMDINEGAYSRFQTAVIQFKSPTTSVTGLTPGSSSVNFEADVLGLPYIKDIQDFVSARGRRAPSTDYLVRAPIPMLIGVSIIIGRTVNDEDVNTDAVKNAIAADINDIGFILGRVPASYVIDAAYTALTGDMVVKSPVQLIGALRKPDGDYVVLRSQTELVVPEYPGTTVSSRTVGVYLSTDDIAVSTVLIDTKTV